MQEIAKPRTLDASAELFLAAGHPERAAVTVGTAMAAKLPAEYARLRDPDLQVVRAGVVEALGELEAVRLINQGGSLDMDEALEKVHSWLTEV